MVFYAVIDSDGYIIRHGLCVAADFLHQGAIVVEGFDGINESLHRYIAGEWVEI